MKENESRDFQPNRRGMLQLAGAVAASSVLGAYAQQGAGGQPRSGGELVIGVAGGGPADSLDAHKPIGEPDISRVTNLYDTLTEYRTDGTVGMMLAESVELAANGTSWVVRLRSGLTFHDGKPIEAEDVIFTLLRITDPRAPMSLASAMTTLKREELKALDRRTVSIPFTKPNVLFNETLADYKAGIVPRGYDPKKPIGSGPFMADTFTPGRRSSFKKFGGYWQAGRPYVDRVTIINFADDSSRVNALQSGQVHAITSLPFSQLAVFEKNPEFVVLETQTDNWRPLGMHCGVAPFQDVRVRQAFRLIVDRKQMVTQVLAGHGRPGNDIWSPGDPATPQIEQRTQDLDKARFLLKSAGHEGLKITLDTAPVIQGLVEFATVFAEQARGVVDVKVNKIPAASYYGDNYRKYPFSLDYKGNRSFLRTAQQSGLPDSPYDLTHFSDPKYLSIMESAFVTVDAVKRAGMIADAQRILHERGGYIIPLFTNTIAARSKRVGGMEGGKTAAIGLPLREYQFKDAYFTS